MSCERKRSRTIMYREVMPAPCLSCPFEGKRPVAMTDNERKKAFGDVLLLKGQHLCHTSKDTKICRGGRNLLLRTLYSKKFLREPTDEAFVEASNAIVRNKECSVLHREN